MLYYVYANRDVSTEEVRYFVSSNPTLDDALFTGFVPSANATVTNAIVERVARFCVKDSRELGVDDSVFNPRGSEIVNIVAPAGTGTTRTVTLTKRSSACCYLFRTPAVSGSGSVAVLPPSGFSFPTLAVDAPITLTADAIYAFVNDTGSGTAMRHMTIADFPEITNFDTFDMTPRMIYSVSMCNVATGEVDAATSWSPLPLSSAGWSSTPGTVFIEKSPATSGVTWLKVTSPSIANRDLIISAVLNPRFARSTDNEDYNAEIEYAWFLNSVQIGPSRRQSVSTKRPFAIDSGGGYVSCSNGDVLEPCYRVVNCVAPGSTTPITGTPRWELLSASFTIVEFKTIV